jgi:hypothetical protein
MGRKIKNPKMRKNLQHLSCKQSAGNSAVISTGKSAGNLFSQVNAQKNPLETFFRRNIPFFCSNNFFINTKKLLKKH